MAGLPPVTLGAIIFGAFAVPYLLRHLLERRWVLPAIVSSRPKRQFFLDFSLVGLAGIIAVAYNMTALSFPLHSGMSLFFGCIVSAYFIGLDLALAVAMENPLVLIDETEGRQAARDWGLRARGSLGILVEAYRRGILGADQLRLAFAEVIRRQDIWINPALVERLQHEILSE